MFGLEKRQKVASVLNTKSHNHSETPFLIDSLGEMAIDDS